MERNRQKQELLKGLQERPEETLRNYCHEGLYKYERHEIREGRKVTRFYVGICRLELDGSSYENAILRLASKVREFVDQGDFQC